ncbi:uncharacterized protein EAE98_002562 [Botrytis deweyae]|uniref:Uncharacterized protein n=1 Tax=Botrytis deweyae TaxID=2478750 RepID=A0ABQ7IXQ1_9HELO|nr:uncharacterized protein EAE98_002562 [Botrytis deweyae]KAF7936343.1 hypothetical protein EAE98_002562 [Botrytis deweyae]
MLIPITAQTPYTRSKAVDRTYLILSSPHRRAIEITLSAFSNTLAGPDVPFLLVLDAREVDVKPCDIGFSLDMLRDVKTLKPFKGEGLTFGTKKIGSDFREDGSNLKKDLYVLNHEAIAAWATALRAWLYMIEAQHTVLVTIGGFLHYLTEDGTISDPKKDVLVTTIVKSETSRLQKTRRQKRLRLLK